MADSPHMIDIDMYLPLKMVLKNSAPWSDVVLRTGTYNDRYSINDMNVWLAHENSGYINDESKTGVLEKPTIIIHQTEESSIDLVEDAVVVAEIQVLVNNPGTKDVKGGRPALDGYTQLCKHITDKEQIWLRKGGFVPRKRRITRPRGGEAIDPNLKGRLLMRSLIVHLSYFGD